MQTFFDQAAHEVQYDSVIERRLVFLLTEANADDAAFDLSVKFTFRLLSNYFTIGQCNANSEGAKLHNRYISKETENLLFNCKDYDEWNKLTTNEHPEPLSQTWEWMRRERRSLTPMEVAKRIKRYPMVTILKAEDQRLRDNGHRSSGLPLERYSAAGIEITCIDTQPKLILAGKRSYRSRKRIALE